MNIINETNFKRITEMKNYLLRTQKDVFTRKEFLQQVGIKNHHFTKMVDDQLIIDTQKAYVGRPGAPHIFKLNEVFTSHMSLNQKYKLSEEDVNILIATKAKKMTTLNNSIKTMTDEIESLERQKNALMQYKGS